MSTGMADLNEVSDAIRIMEASRLSRENLTLLHCTSEYPAPIEEVNLRAMTAMGDFFESDMGTLIIRMESMWL